METLSLNHKAPRPKSHQKWLEVPVKTTIDLPEDLLHRAKVVAAQRKTTLKDLVFQGLDYIIQHDVPDPEAERKARAQKLLELMSRIQITEPIGKWNRDEIYDRHRGKWE